MESLAIKCGRQACIQVIEFNNAVCNLRHFYENMDTRTFTCAFMKGKAFKKVWKNEWGSATQKNQRLLQVQKQYILKVKAKSEETFENLEEFYHMRHRLNTEIVVGLGKRMDSGHVEGGVPIGQPDGYVVRTQGNLRENAVPRSSM